MSLILYTNPMSRGRIARWMLEEIGQPHETKIVQYGAEMKGPEFCAINPMGKIPALCHDETVVTETAAIIAYLADAFPEAGLAPPLGSHLRGAYFRWMFFAAGPWEAATTNRALNVVVPPERAGFVGYGSYEAVVDVMEAAVAHGPFLLGEQFTAADVYFGSQIGFGLRFGTLEKRPAFDAYWTHLSSRPAFQKAAALDDALMPPKAS